MIFGPLKRFGDLCLAGISHHDSQIRNSHKHLKIDPNDMKMWRMMIVSIHLDRNRAKAMQYGQANSSIYKVQLLHYSKGKSNDDPHKTTKAASLLRMRPQQLYRAAGTYVVGAESLMVLKLKQPAGCQLMICRCACQRRFHNQSSGLR